ncbi:LamG-like jellyroll fold domain-containing protein [Streptomyces sp. NPDC088190]|uniref:LamG-like jellyroll fold domain-containing protein n=1 Tax=unclassified Streptomyces TaxID=2593676 RepID=UPI0038219B1F
MWRRLRGRRGAGVVAAVALSLLAGGALTPQAVAAPVPQAPKAAEPTGGDTASTAGSDAESSIDAAQARAKREGRPVEVMSLRGESREVFATPDGNLEAQEHLRPVRTRVGGEWKAIDTALARTGDGGVAPKASTVGLEFSGGGSTPLVRMKKAGRELALSWPGKLPAPSLDGATATYAEVLPGVDLRMEAQEDGFAQLLVVKSAQAAQSEELAELRLRLAVDGMDVNTTAEGGLEAVDKGAKGAVFEAPKPLMWDSSSVAPESSAKSAASARSAAAEPSERVSPAESGRLAPVGVEIAPGGGELVLTPDAGLLKGADTTYPVFIDPQWYSPRASAWTMASQYWASSPQWKFNGESTAGMGFCNWDYCAPNDTKRLFYRVPTSTYAGKSILSAEFVVHNSWSASCSARKVQLWRTKDISSSTTWNSQNAAGFWIKKLQTESFAYGFTGCAAKDAEFDVKAAVQEAANGKWSTMTFGLQADDESDKYGWKRFSDKAVLRVKYNRPPVQVKMSQLVMEYGGVCKRPEQAARVRTLGTIKATQVTDPDKDNVSVQFQASWDAGDGKGNIARWNPARTPSMPSGSTFVVSLPTSIPQNKRVSWQVRVYDGAEYSPWSSAGDPTGCYFTYDTSVPKAPSVTSSDYPASDPGNPEDPWYDGVGVYGAFQIKAAESDVTKYQYGLNGSPLPKNEVTTSGGAEKTVQILPSEPGLNFLTVRSLDAAGNGSEERTYFFRVKNGQPEKAAWRMDDEAGATEARGTAGARVAALKGGATAGVPGVLGTAVSFDGVDDYAVTDIPTVATETGFSVSAWANLSRMPDTAAIIAAQPGNYSPSFELYYSKAYDRWVFNQYTADTATAGAVRAMAPNPGGVAPGQWTHLVGTYSSASKELKLYVQGTLVGTTTYSTPWDARRGLQIGAGSYGGQQASFFPGAIDEVRIFDKPISATEVTNLYNKQPIGSGRPARSVFSMDEPAGATEITGRADVHPAVLQGDAVTGQRGVDGNALTLDGDGDYAVSGAPHVNNQRSFTVSAWAKMPKTKPTHAAIIASQTSAHKPGFELYYSNAYDRWVFNQYVSDTSDASAVRAMQPEGTIAYGGGWVHLVGVMDTVVDRLTLYVNGVEAGQAKAATTWYAGGPVQIGAGSYDGKPGSYFPGQIDDVRLYDRPLSAGEVQQMFRQSPVLKGRWNFEKTTAGTPVSTPDSSGESSAMNLYGGAKTGPGTIDDQGLQLDGVDSYGEVPAMPVDTGSSFTVTAWAQAAALPDHPMTVVSAGGSKRSAFDVRFRPDPADPQAPGSWELTLPDANSSTAAVKQVSNTEFFDVRDWNHLTVVYDGFAKEARLYVNGVLQEVACGDSDGDGAADDSACQDLVAWADNVLTFQADKGMQVGRTMAGTASDYFAGTIDDVWAFEGALNGSQVSYLANTWFDIPAEVPVGS